MLTALFLACRDACRFRFRSGLLDTGDQLLTCGDTISQLGSLALGPHLDARRGMLQLHRRGGTVDVLASRSTRTYETLHEILSPYAELG